MNIMDLIDRLQDIADLYGEATDVRLATQPSWPFEWDVGNVVAVSDDDGHAAAYVSEGTQLGYLPGAAATELGWK